MEAISEERDQVAVHLAGRGEAVQQQQGRGVAGPGFAIEQVDSLDLDASMVHGVARLGHGAAGFFAGMG